MMDFLSRCFLIQILFSYICYGCAEIIYVNKSLTWDEARSYCTYTYKGKLLPFSTSAPTYAELTTCIPNNVNVWTGVYTKVSPTWVTIEGCHSLRSGSPLVLGQYTYHNLTEASLGECINICNPGDRDRIALMNTLCICGNGEDFVNFEKTDDRNCTLTCDVHAICGGSNSFMVYRRSTYRGDNDGQYCVAARCAPGLVVDDRTCDDQNRGICGSGLSSPFTDRTASFHSSMDRCLETQGSFLIGQSINSFCDLSRISNTDFWIGLFRTEYHLYDQGADCYYTETGTDYRGSVNVTENGQDCLPFPDSEYNFCRNEIDGRADRPWCFYLSDGDVEWGFCNIPRCDQPYRILQIKNADNRTSTNLVMHTATELSPFLCEAELQNIDVQEDDIICTGMTSPTTTTPTIRTERSISTTEDLETVIINSRTIRPMNGVTLGVVIGISSVVGLAIAMSVLLVVIYLRRKNKKTIPEDDDRVQHTYTNMGYTGESPSERNSDHFQNTDNKSGVIKTLDDYNTTRSQNKRWGDEDIYTEQPEGEYDHLRGTATRHLKREKSDIYNHVHQQYTESDDVYDRAVQLQVSQSLSDLYDVARNYTNGRTDHYETIN